MCFSVEQVLVASYDGITITGPIIVLRSPSCID